MSVLRRAQIGAERLLDDDAPPVPVFLSQQPGVAKPLGDDGERLRRRRQVEQVVAAGVLRLRQSWPSAAPASRRPPGLEVALQIGHAAARANSASSPAIVPSANSRKARASSRRKASSSLRAAGDADDREIVRQQPARLRL